MKNTINWFEIPASNIKRAISFYESILGFEIQEIEMLGTKMGLFPSNGKNVSGAIVEGKDYKPSSNGALVYLNGGDDLQVILDKIEVNSGKIIMGKTLINPEMGYFGLFIDTEGNKMAIHSIN